MGFALLRGYHNDRPYPKRPMSSSVLYSIAFRRHLPVLGATVLLALTFATQASAEAAGPVGPVLAPASSARVQASAPTELQLIEAWGWLLADDAGATRCALTPEEQAAFVRGLSAGLTLERSPCDQGKIAAELEQFIDDRQEAFLQPVTKKNLAEAAAILADLKKRPDVVSLSNGSCYETIRKGSGPKPEPFQTAVVSVHGTLPGGAEFVDDGPHDVVLVPKMARQGLYEGILQMAKGGRIRLYVPPSLAEPNAHKLAIPRGSLMIYEIELHAIKQTGPDELESAHLPPPAEPPPPPPSGFSREQVIAAWGWNLAQRSWAARFGFDEPRRAALLKGTAAAVAGTPLPGELKAAVPEVIQYVTVNRERIQQATLKKRSAETEKFFAELKKNPKVVVLPSGLCYEIVQPGTGPCPGPDQRLSVHYTGRLINGTVFDSSDPTIGPLNVDLDKVMRGWTEGAQHINKGGKIRLYIPPALAYGSESGGQIPPNSTLIFDIELIDFSPIPPEDRTPPPARSAP